jgi:hypothetical protein
MVTHHFALQFDEVIETPFTINDAVVAGEFQPGRLNPDH